METSHRSDLLNFAVVPPLTTPPSSRGRVKPKMRFDSHSIISWGLSL